MKKRMVEIYVEETGDDSIAVACDVQWDKSYGLYVRALKGILEALEKCDNKAFMDAVELIIKESVGGDDK